MKKICLLLMAMPLLFASCSKEIESCKKEPVTIDFCANFTDAAATKAGESLVADKVWCAVFENGVEIRPLREVYTVSGTQGVVYAPVLLKGHTYDIVFWASKNGCYVTDDLTSITRAANGSSSEADYDAYTAKTTILVADSKTETVVLKRPLAQLNVGVITEDWQAISDPAKLNITPKNTIITFEGKNAFNALEGKSTGKSQEIVYNLPISGSDLTCNGKTYKSVGLCYIFPESEKQTADITLDFYGDKNVTIRENLFVPHVPLQVNYRTNIVGNMFTSSIRYNVSIDTNFANSSVVEQF